MLCRTDSKGYSAVSTCVDQRSPSYAENDYETINKTRVWQFLQHKFLEIIVSGLREVSKRVNHIN